MQNKPNQSSGEQGTYLSIYIFFSCGCRNPLELAVGGHYFQKFGTFLRGNIIPTFPLLFCCETQEIALRYFLSQDKWKVNILYEDEHSPLVHISEFFTI